MRSSIAKAEPYRTEGGRAAAHCPLIRVSIAPVLIKPGALPPDCVLADYSAELFFAVAFSLKCCADPRSLLALDRAPERRLLQVGCSANQPGRSEGHQPDDRYS